MGHTISRSAWTWTAVGFLVLAGQAAPDAPRRPYFDAFGDPLPTGATARFGGLSWRMSSEILAVALSADGQRVAASDWERNLVVWDTANGREVLPFRWVGQQVYALAFSPDGRYLVTCGTEPYIETFRKRVFCVWDLEAGREKTRWEAKPRFVGPLAFAADGKTLLSGGRFQPAMVWDADTGQKVRQFPDDGSVPYFAAVAPNGRHVVVAPDETHFHIYDFPGGRLQYKVTSPDRLDGIAFAPDSRTLLTWDRLRLRQWELATGKLRVRFGFKEGDVCWVAFSADSKRLALFGTGNGIRWRDTVSGKDLGSWQGHQGTVGALAFAADGRTAVSGGMDGTVRLWDAATGQGLRAPAGCDRECWSLHFGPGGKSLLAGSADLHFLDGATLQEQHRLHVDGADWRSLVLTPDSRLAAVLDNDGKALLLDVAARKVVRTLADAKSSIRSLAFGPDGKELYAIGTLPALRVLDVATGKEKPPLCMDLDEAYGVAVSPAGKLLLSQGRTTYLSELRLWDLATGKEEKAPAFKAHAPLPSPDGKRVVVNGPGLEVMVWDLGDRGEPRPFKGAGAAYARCFSADGKWLATGHSYGLICVWDVAAGTKVAEWKGHRGTVMALAFAPDGTALVSGGAEGTALRWAAAAWRPK
jgi:WD40 repeat protein